MDDALELIIAVVVTAANGEDRQGLVALLTTYFASGVKRLRKIGVDKGYEAQRLRDWARGLKQTYKIDVEVVERTGKGFGVVKQRWKVEVVFPGEITQELEPLDTDAIVIGESSNLDLGF